MPLRPKPGQAPGSPSPAVVPRSLPRGRARLPREIAALSQRTRLLDSMVAIGAEKGYEGTTVAAVISLAGVSRSTFYEQFDDKVDCFLAAYERAATAHLEHITAASSRATGWLESHRAAVRAYVEGMAAEPTHARLFLVDVLATGQPGVERRRAIHSRHARLLREWYEAGRAAHPDLPALPDELFHACVAAANEIVLERLRPSDGEPDLSGLEELVDYSQLALLGVAGLAEAD